MSVVFVPAATLEQRFRKHFTCLEELNVFVVSCQLWDKWDRRAGAAGAQQSCWSRCRGWMGELRSFLVLGS